MAKQWQQFEIDCCNWLNEQFGDLATFQAEGGSNSNVSDIHVICPNGVQFYIEVKAPSSQCSQFVLFPDLESRTFIYSSKNKLEMNPFTQHLIDYMDAHFDLYCNPTTAPLYIDPAAAEAAGHIRYQHMVKGVEFFLSKNNIGYILIPLSLIGFYFEIIAVYRRKTSGSHNIANRNIPKVSKWIKDYYDIDCQITDKTIKIPLRNDLVNVPIDIDGLRIIFRSDDNGFMTLRGLSTTQNPNVIFTITIKDDTEGLPIEYFKTFLTMVGTKH